MKAGLRESRHRHLQPFLPEPPVRPRHFNAPLELLRMVYSELGKASVDLLPQGIDVLQTHFCSSSIQCLSRILGAHSRFRMRRPAPDSGTTFGENPLFDWFINVDLSDVSGPRLQCPQAPSASESSAVSYTHLRAHE